MSLQKFLVKAKIATYASEGEIRTLEDGSKELTFEGDGFQYRDRYFGFNPFSGQEVVWKDGNVIWSMNYYGGINSDSVPEKEVYEFLRKAMRRVGKDNPFRGPGKFTEGDFEYKDKPYGNVDFFLGDETISFRGEEIYHLAYHGGRMQNHSLLPKR